MIADAKPPLVSIVVPFLNAAPFLDETVESVMRQTYADWELILVDDGSTDGTGDIARSYAENDPSRVRYVRHPVGRNPSAARNHGILHASGSVVAFLDADDVWLPTKLQEQVAVFDAHPEASLVYGAVELWSSWAGADGSPSGDMVYPLGIEADRLYMPPVLLRLVLESKAPTPGTSCFMVRRSVLERLGGFEEEFCARNALFEDQVFLSKVFLNEPVYVSSARCARYRQHQHSRVALANRRGLKLASGLAFCDFVHSYLSARGVEDEALWRALRKKRWRYRHPRLDRRRQALMALGRKGLLLAKWPQVQFSYRVAPVLRRVTAGRRSV